MKWEEKAKALTKVFGETFNDTVKVGIVVSIMLQDVQELVYQSIEDKLGYDEVTAKIRSVVSNKVAMMEGPAPMDVGKVDDKCESEDLEDDVAAVSWSTRLGCGGSNHQHRKSPSITNDGKGSKALVKGPGERSNEKGPPTTGGQKGDSRGAKGSGVGGFKGAERTSARPTPRTPSRKRMRRRPPFG